MFKKSLHGIRKKLKQMVLCQILICGFKTSCVVTKRESGAENSSQYIMSGLLPFPGPHQRLLNQKSAQCV